MSPSLRTAAVLGLCAVSGAGTMVVELAAVRVLAPWFGASLVVWTNVIAVVLCALALGYAIGGRLSRGPHPLALLARVLAVAAALTAWVPWAAGPITSLFLPGELALHEAADVLAWSSLASAALLFLPPAVCLGMVAPLAVESVQRASAEGPPERGEARTGDHAGRAGGLVLCASTLGSLLGVFSTSHLLLPGLGLRGTHWMAAATLGLAALAAWRMAGGRAQALVILGALGAGLASAWAAAPADRLGAEQELLASVDSAYQRVRVVSDGSFEPPLRFLQVNEGFDSYQSVWQADPGALPEGFYYNAFALPPLWAGMEDPAPQDWNLLVLGLGAGTVFRVLDGLEQEASVRFARRDGVELDETVVRLAREHMQLSEETETTSVVGGLDARAALQHVTWPLDYVVLDCYANQVEIPAHLATHEFFQEVRERLRAGGWLAVNVGAFGFDDPILAALASTLGAAFETPVLAVRIPAARNFVLFARRDAALPIDGVADDGKSGGRLRWPDSPAADWMAPLALPGGWRLLSPAPSPDETLLVLRDDHAPTEWLQARSIREAQRRHAANADGPPPGTASQRAGTSETLQVRQPDGRLGPRSEPRLRPGDPAASAPGEGVRGR